MKRVFILAAAALMSIGAFAQTDLNTFQIVDKKGNVITDGTTLTLTETENSPQYGLIISTGLSVKNTTAEEQAVGIDLNITKMENGSVSCCFPANCQQFTLGEYIDANSPDIMEANETRDIQTEWIPKAYGKCTAILQFKVHDIEMQEIFGTKFPAAGAFRAYGPKITINFEYKDPAGINDITSDSNAKVVARYNANGMRVNSAMKGLNIEKLSNGKTIKRILK